MSVNQRVSEWINLMKKKGLSQRKLAEIFERTPQYISELSREKGSCGLNVITKILVFNEELNARWLVLGEGNMYPQDEKDNTENSIVFKETYIEEQKMLLKKIEETKDSQILDLKGQIEYLKKIIDEKL